MKTFGALVILVSCFFVLNSSAQEAKNIELKYNMDYLEKTWGIKMKASEVDLRMVGGSEVKLLLEFTKDVENLAEMRAALTPIIINSAKDVRTPKLYFYFFDEDNVSLAKVPIKSAQGELTGKKGDAFRITIGQIGGTDLKKAKKVEARPAEVSEKK